MDRPAFPKPCVITIGMTKGGSCKTWWAFNLATTLGMNGYRVVVLDLNPQHDLTADSQILLEQGIYPRFDAFSYDITDENGNINPMPDLSPYFDYDFIIYDTPQFLNYPVIRFAWQNCHLMLAPFTPDCADLKNYTAAVRQYRAMPGERGPIACIPSRVSKMKNSLALQALNDCLGLMGDLGCDVPEYPQAYMIDYNPSLALQNTRWIYNKMTFRGADRAVTQKFLDNVHLNLGWILMVLQKYYGPLPPAPLPNIPRDDPDEIRASLAAEFRDRFQSVAEAV